MGSPLRKRVLIADDYDHLAQILAEFVEHETTFEAMAVKDGREALNLALIKRPSACVLDVDMPHIGGIVAAKFIRSAFVERRPLLVAMTGGSEFEAQQSGMFDHVLRKPIDFAQLLALLETAEA